MGPESGGLQDAYMKLKFLEIFSPFFNGTELQQAIGGRECAEWPQSWSRKRPLPGGGFPAPPDPAGGLPGGPPGPPGPRPGVDCGIFCHNLHPSRLW